MEARIDARRSKPIDGGGAPQSQQGSTPPRSCTTQHNSEHTRTMHIERSHNSVLEHYTWQDKGSSEQADVRQSPSS